MKYDRPVWQIMHACADAMPDIFRYEHVREWFGENYPDVNEATIRAHLIGLTEGGRAKHVQFAQRSPVFQRVARGEYRAIPIAERGENPNEGAPSTSKIKLTSDRVTPAPAEVEEPARAPEFRTPEAPSTKSGRPRISLDAILPPPRPPVREPQFDASEYAAPAPATEETVEVVSTPERVSARPSMEPEVEEPAARADAIDEVDAIDAIDNADEVEIERPPVIRVDEDTPETTPPDIILLGSLGDRVNVPAPAKEVFREVAFQLSRIEAEVGAAEWFILSAEHGLVAPNEWMSPDSRTLAEMDPEYRVTWATWVVARLQSLVGSIDGKLIRVDAPDAFVGPLFADLQDAGAIVSSGNIGVTVPPLMTSSMGERKLAAHLSAALDDRDLQIGSESETSVDADPVRAETVTPEPIDAEPVETSAASTHPTDGSEMHTDTDTDTEESVDDVRSTVVPIDPAALPSLHLSDHRNAVPASELESLPESPGLYGWFVDPIGARELNRCLMLPVRAGLIFVGQVGGSSWQSLADPVLNLRDHVERIQLHGRARASTFRMTLATVLRDHLGMKSTEDPALTAWMLEHLSISFWPTEDFSRLRELEQLVVAQLDPPLNVDHLPASEYRARLNQMRSALA